MNFIKNIIYFILSIQNKILTNRLNKTLGVKNAVVNFMTLKMSVEFEDGADVDSVMKDVITNCKIVEDDCEIYL